MDAPALLREFDARSEGETVCNAPPDGVSAMGGFETITGEFADPLDRGVSPGVEREA